MHGQELQHVRQELRDHGHGMIYNGGEIVIWAERYAEAIDALEEQQLKLKTSNVIVSQSLLPSLEACLLSIPRRHNVRLRRKRRLELSTTFRVIDSITECLIGESSRQQT